MDEVSFPSPARGTQEEPQVEMSSQEEKLMVSKDTRELENEVRMENDDKVET